MAVQSIPWLPITVHQLLCNTVVAVYRGKRYRDEKSLPRKALENTSLPMYRFCFVLSWVPFLEVILLPLVAMRRLSVTKHRGGDWSRHLSKTQSKMNGAHQDQPSSQILYVLCATCILVRISCEYWLRMSNAPGNAWNIFLFIFFHHAVPFIYMEDICLE